MREGVYSSPKIQKAELYGDPVIIREVGNRKEFKIVLQCRINPNNFRDNGSYYYVTESEDIRPYGILLKTVNIDEKTDEKILIESLTLFLNFLCKITLLKRP